MRNLTLLALTASVLAAAASAQTAPSTIKKGVLMIGIEGTYPPFTYKDDKGNLTGYDVELARLLAAKLGLKPEFVLTEWSGILAGLQASKYDVIINQVGITEERKKSIAYSDPYVFSRAQIAVTTKSGFNPKTLQDLKGKRVGVGLGTTFEKGLRDVGGINIVTYSSTPDNIADLMAGRIDALFNDRLVIAYIAKSQNLPIKGTAAVGSGLDQMGIAIRKDNTSLKKAIDAALKAMKADGSTAKLGDTWFGQDVSKP